MMSGKRRNAIVLNIDNADQPLSFSVDGELYPQALVAQFCRRQPIECGETGGRRRAAGGRRAVPCNRTEAISGQRISRSKSNHPTGRDGCRYNGICRHRLMAAWRRRMLRWARSLVKEAALLRPAPWQYRRFVPASSVSHFVSDFLFKNRKLRPGKQLQEIDPIRSNRHSS